VQNDTGGLPGSRNPCKNALVLCFQYLVSEVRRELNLRKLEIELGDSTDKISENFRRLMNEALAAADTDVLIIFDEIENISPMTAASAHRREHDDALLFWQTVRAFFQSLRKHKLSFCFVGTNPHLIEMTKLHEIDNPVVSVCSEDIHSDVNTS